MSNLLAALVVVMIGAAVVLARKVRRLAVQVSGVLTPEELACLAEAAEDFWIAAEGESGDAEFDAAVAMAHSVEAVVQARTRPDPESP